MKQRIILVIAISLVLGGCSQSLTLETTSDVPAPLVDQLPLTMGIYYEDAFRNYI